MAEWRFARVDHSFAAHVFTAVRAFDGVVAHLDDFGNLAPSAASALTTRSQSPPRAIFTRPFSPKPSTVKCVRRGHSSCDNSKLRRAQVPSAIGRGDGKHSDRRHQSHGQSHAAGQWSGPKHLSQVDVRGSGQCIAVRAGQHVGIELGGMLRVFGQLDSRQQAIVELPETPLQQQRHAPVAQRHQQPRNEIACHDPHQAPRRAPSTTRPAAVAAARTPSPAPD